MFRFIGHLRDKYRAWQEQRGERWLCQLVARAQDPVEKKRRELENEGLYGRLNLTEDGFRLDKHGRCEYVVRWNDVRVIRTYKQDHWCYDEIMLAFEIGEDTWVEASESMPGFKTVVSRMERMFAGISKDWYKVVMVPPFEANLRTLWTRSETRKPDEVYHA